MIKWKCIKTEQPEDGDLVWVLLCHWKEKKRGSYEIFRGYTVKVAGGEVESFTGKENIRQWNVCTCDDDGAGNYCYYPEGHEFLDKYEGLYEVFSYWCYDYEINVPMITDKQ